MPKNQVNDLITDQEIAFAHLVLSGTMTDRRAAEAVGLNPDTAAYTKAKPRVQAYMLEHRAAMHEQRVQQETEGLRRLNQGREKVLARLWEIANLDPEMTRNSASAQIKALSMIVAIEGLIPDRRTASAPNKSPQPASPQIDTAAWLREQQGKPRFPSPALTLSVTKMGLAFPILRPARRQTRLRTRALILTPASSSSPAPLAPRKRPRWRLMPPCPLLLQTTGSLPLWKRNPIPGA
jgi:hypothetical protein